MECLQFYSKHLLLEITENGHVLHCPNVEITIEVGPRVQIVSDVHSPAIKISGEKDPCDFTLAQNDSGVLQTSGTCLFQNKTCIMPQRFMEEQ